MRSGAHLVRLAFSRARAHGIYPQVWIHVVRADARVGVGDVRQSSHLLPRRPHRHARRHDPNRARELQQHLQSGTRRKSEEQIKNPRSFLARRWKRARSVRVVVGGKGS